MSDGALSSLHTLTQFERAEVSNRVAILVQRCEELRRDMDVASDSVESTARQLQESLGRVRLNPELIFAIRSFYRTERQRLNELQKQLIEARDEEQRVRDELAQVHRCERSLEDVMSASRMERRQREQSKEFAVLDDLWLQSRGTR